MAFAAIGTAIGVTASVAASTAAGVAATAAAVGAVGSAVSAGSSASKNRKAAQLEAAKARREEQRLERLEAMRQPVINQAGKIRAMKNQVFNPAANMGVAMQAANIQMEETDKALANTLDAITAGGPGAGNATALAQMAAMSKAQVAASIETQEAQNMQSRIQGEATRQEAIRNLETTALAEEVSAWGRTEERDLAKMDRVAGLADRAQQQSVAYEQAAQQNTADMWGGITDVGTSMLGGLTTQKGD